jgi:hypothetical protein
VRVCVCVCVCAWVYVVVVVVRMRACVQLGWDEEEEKLHVILKYMFTIEGEMNWIFRKTAERSIRKQEKQAKNNDQSKSIAIAENRPFPFSCSSHLPTTHHAQHTRTTRTTHTHTHTHTHTSESREGGVEFFEDLK